MNALTPIQEQIAVRAYHLYLETGCQNGHDIDHWLAAEKEIGGKFFAPPPMKKKAASKKAPAKKPAVVKKAATKKATKAKQ